MPGAGLSDGCNGKALSDMPAFQPYWGKPAVRNDRGDGGNVGIIRSPLRATVPPDFGRVPRVLVTRSGRISTDLKGSSLHTHNALDNAIEQAEMFSSMRKQAARPGKWNTEASWI